MKLVWLTPPLFLELEIIVWNLLKNESGAILSKSLQNLCGKQAICKSFWKKLFGEVFILLYVLCSQIEDLHR